MFCLKSVLSSINRSSPDFYGYYFSATISFNILSFSVFVFHYVLYKREDGGIFKKKALTNNVCPLPRGLDPVIFAIIDTIGLIHHFCAFYLSELFNFPFLSFNVSFRISCFQSFYFLKISICKFDSVFYILL